MEPSKSALPKSFAFAQLTLNWLSDNFLINAGPNGLTLVDIIPDLGLIVDGHFKIAQHIAFIEHKAMYRYRCRIYCFHTRRVSESIFNGYSPTSFQIIPPPFDYCTVNTP